MKQKTKNLIALSLTATFCGALAAVAMFTNVAKVSASTAPIFKMANGASIRYTSEEGKKEGLRFLVLADETTKNAIVESGTFGVIISSAEDFANIDGDYLNHLDQLNYETTKELTDPTKIEEMFYEGRDEYLGYWCANIVINMGTNDMEENFTKRTYSAVAYYPTATDTYAYTENRQERSIQNVASKVYMQGDDDWANVKNTYSGIGTETTPFLVSQSGDNAYKTLIRQVGNDADFSKGYYYELTENVFVEKVLSQDENFQGTFVDTEYTETVPTGMVYDGTDASAITVSAKGWNNTNLPGLITKEFDKTVKFDEKSNGSAKITIRAGEKLDENLDVGIANAYIGVAPEFSNAYYQNLLDNGYNHIVIRYMVANDPVCPITISADYNKEGTEHYKQDGSLLSGAKHSLYVEKNYYTNTWFERVVPISFTSFSPLNDYFIRIQNIPSNKAVCIYIDNIYFAKSAGEYNTQVLEMEQNSQYAVEKADAYNVTESYTANGAAVTPESGVLAIEKGYYTASFRAYNRYGVARAEMVTKVNETSTCAEIALFTEENYAEKISCTGVSALSSTTPTGSVSISYEFGGVKLYPSLKTGWFDLSVKISESVEYYTYLKEQGFKYVTFKIGCDYGEFVLQSLNSPSLQTHPGNILAKGSDWGASCIISTVTQNEGAEDTIAYSKSVAWWGPGNRGYSTRSILIDDLIAQCKDGNFTFLRVLKQNYDISLYLAGIYATKDGKIV